MALPQVIPSPTDREPAIVGVLGLKGGVGKSLLAQLVAILAALQGYTVWLIDMDGNPGQTAMFCHFQELLEGRRGIQRELQRDPMRRTVQRVVLHPRQGLDGVGLDYPLRQVLTELLPQRPRFKVSNIDSTSIAQRTIAHYGLDLSHLGSLTVVPNAGSFEPLVQEIERKHLTDNLFDPDVIVADALRETVRAERSRGMPTPHLIVIDTAGERGLLPRMIAFAATHVLLPLEPTDLALSGAINTADDLTEVRNLRGSQQGYPCVLPAIINKFDPNPEEELAEWVSDEATPALGDVGVRICPRYIPRSYDIETRASRKGILPFEYNPLDPVVMAVGAIWNDLRPSVFG